MSTSEIEKHLQNQIISLNKEIHTKQGIIGGVQSCHFQQISSILFCKLHYYTSFNLKRKATILSETIYGIQY